MGSSYNTYVHFDFSHSIDTQSYIKVANGDFDVNPVHRYRVIVPYMAKAVSKPFESFYTKIWSKRKHNTWPLQLGFYIVNSLICALAGLVLFRLARCYDINPIWAMVGILSVLTSRWLCYMAGLPLTDSLYLLIIAVTFLALKTENKILFYLAVFLGPFAKESYIFIAPILFIYGKEKWPLKIGAFALSAALVFTVRYLIDHMSGLEHGKDMERAFDHFNDIIYSLKRMFSIKGMGEIFSVINMFWIVIVLGFTRGKKAILSWATHMEIWMYLLVPAIMTHVLLSGDIARMMLFAAPFLVVSIGLILEHHPLFEKVRQQLTSTSLKKS